MLRRVWLLSVWAECVIVDGVMSGYSGLLVLMIEVLAVLRR